MSRLKLIFTILLVAFAALGAAVVNQLHNHAFSNCESGPAHHDTPCPVSIFFANFAGETSAPIVPTNDVAVVCVIRVEPAQSDFGFDVEVESTRAPPLV